MHHRPDQGIHILIIGGGIAGLALGIGLDRRNVSYTIYEASTELSFAGAGIALGPNTTRAMALLDPALREAYDSISTKNQSLGKEHHFADFLLAEPRFGASQGFHGAAVASEHFVRSGAHRKDLMGVMRSLLSTDDKIVFGKRAVQVRQVGDKVKVEFADGSCVEADAVVGCDGGKGVTRCAVLGGTYPDQVDVAYSGRYVYRAVIPPGKGQEVLGEYADDSKIFLGKGIYFAAYPLSGGGFNFLAGRQTDEPWGHPHWTCEVTKEDMLRDFEGCDARLLRLLEWASPLRWGLFHHLHTPTYHNGLVALLGDVAHASTPHQGAGAGQCFEDALVMSHLLARVKSVAELEAVFEVYDSICRPRAQEIVRTSNETGLLYTMTHPDCGEDMDKITSNARQRFHWIWTHDLEGDLRQAEDGLQASMARRSTTESS
ncbi:hypothetical protein QQS21_004341 [Conoideocrella luteorostrata]|uniref:FAD-binding domain-containing protein n=1 Tax=Conoideocrella luteorostrata TaxID=1105319 RepID=A0AAJ0CU15_9HYPO|nr:hypothetical protein QQS21_004341 [Conoideocrella luteorostrata]